MKPGPKAICDLITSNFPISSSPKDFEEVIKGCFYDQRLKGEDGWLLNDMEIEEKTAKWKSNVEMLISRHITTTVNEGRQPRIAFNSSSPYLVQGSCFIEPVDTDIVKLQKTNREKLDEYREVLKSLDPKNFERLCSKVLGLLGVPSPQLTQYQGDEGIDFYGHLSFGDLVGHGPKFPVFETRITVWFIGQAKHYQKIKVATPDIRDLVGATFLGRAKSFAKPHLYPDLNVRVCDPVIILFFTTGSISSDGWELCNNSGVVAMDGEMLSAFLADKGKGVKNDGEGKIIFDTTTFYNWLNEEI